MRACASPKGFFHSSIVPSKFHASIKYHQLIQGSLGFASDDPDAEAWAIRYFASRDTLEFAIVQSFSKNMGLYGERVGALHFLAATADVALTIKGHLSRLQRGNISQPPTRGAMIATTILKSPDLYREWLLDLKKVSTRIRNMRKLMYDELIRLKTPGSWEHLRTQVKLSCAQISQYRRKS